MTIHLEASTRAAAVLTIFRDQTRQPGDVLSAAELRLAWNDVGLRRTDLDLALRELAEQGLLDESRRGNEPWYALTGEGAVLLAHPGSGLLTRIVDWWFLELARRRPHAAIENAGGHRRLGDAVTS
jgi:DNA-binding transcriptional regulator PaaX